MKILTAFLVVFFQLNIVLSQSPNSFNIIPTRIDQLILDKQFVFSEKNINSDIKFVLDNDDIFELNQSQYVNRGVFYKNHWLKIKLVNQSENTDFVFEFNNNYADSLYAFIISDHSVIRKFPKKGLYFKSDGASNFLTNKYGHNYHIDLPKNDTISFYINAVVNDGPFRVISKLYTQKGYVSRKAEVRLKTTYLLLLLGFISLVMIFSIVMFFISKKRLYLYYFGFVFSITLNIICVNHFVSPDLIEKYLLFGNNYTEMLSYLQVFFVLLYANHFLSIKSKNVNIYNIIIYLAVINIFVFLLGLYLRQYDFYYAFSFYFSKIVLTIITLLIYSFSIYLARNKDLMAKYFVIAYTPLVGFVVYIIMQSLNLVSFSNPISWELITFFEIIVLLIALVHQYYLLLKEKSSYQQTIKNQTQESTHIRLKSKAVLLLDKLMYIKSDTHYLEFYMEGKDKPEIDRITFKKIEDTLPKEKFVRVHKSYMVNINYIKIFNSTQLMLENEQWINISRTYKSRLKQMVDLGK